MAKAEAPAGVYLSCVFLSGCWGRHVFEGGGDHTGPSCQQPMAALHAAWTEDGRFPLQIPEIFLLRSDQICCAPGLTLHHSVLPEPDTIRNAGGFIPNFFG